MREAGVDVGDLFEIAHVGPYLLTEALGSGNYGKVRKAVHEVTRQEVAIKAVPAGALSRTLPRNIDIRREMSIQQALSHENIIELHEVIVANDFVYLVMEYAAHGDFFRIISKRGRFSEHSAHTYFRQLVSAVAYCHERGVYHRDLKPENLLLSQNGLLKLTDFGFSAMKDHGPPVLKTNCGSPHYCAPEVWNGTQEGYDGRKSDAFSAGVVLFVMLTGTQPFYDDDEERLLAKVNKCKVSYPEWLGVDVKDLLSKLLVKDPQLRWGLDKVGLHPWFVQGAESSEEKLSRRIVAQREYKKKQQQSIVKEKQIIAEKPRLYDGSLLLSARALMRVF